MKTCKFFTSFEKEEKWLGSMEQKGFQMINKRLFIYTFAKTSSRRSIIKLDYRSFKTQDAFEDYCALFEDSGWEHIFGTKNSGHQYFRKANKQGSEEIFSDTASIAGRYKRLSDMWQTLSFSLFPIGVAVITTMPLDSKTLSLKTPLSFVTPVLWFSFFVTFLLYFYFAYKANKQYKQILKG